MKRDLGPLLQDGLEEMDFDSRNSFLEMVGLGCPECGEDSEEYFQIGTEPYTRIVCKHCLTDALKELIEAIVLREGCLNSMAICRIVNNRGDYPRECYDGQGFSYETRNQRCAHKTNTCRVWSLRVYKELRKLEKKGKVHSRKRRFWDDRNGTGRKFDTFRFWYFDEASYAERILAQTLEFWLRPLSRQALAYAFGLNPERFSEADLAENVRQCRDLERENDSSMA